MFWRKESVAVPEIGADAPEFNLPSAQGGQLRLSMRTARGPVAVVFYRPDDPEDVEYFKRLAEREDEINMAAGSVVGIGVAEPHEARELVRASGIKSFVLYDYARVTSRQWGLFERDKKNGDYARPAVFLVSPDHKVVHAWTNGRPDPEEILAKVTEVSGLPKAPEEPKADETETEEGVEKPKKMSAEERERIKAERRAAREAGKPVKQPADASGGETADKPDAPAAEAGSPPKMSKEEREKIKAERRAARDAGQTLKRSTSEAAPGQANAAEVASAEAASTEAAPADAPKKMSKEERERQKAERRAAREAKAEAEGNTEE